MIVSEISMYNLLRDKFGEQDTQSFVEGLKQEIKNEFENHKAIFATKEDISRLEIKISETKAELIKWMLIFWIGTIGVLSGIMFAMLNAYLK